MFKGLKKKTKDKLAGGKSDGYTPPAPDGRDTGHRARDSSEQALNGNSKGPEPVYKKPPTRDAEAARARQGLDPEIQSLTPPASDTGLRPRTPQVIFSPEPLKNLEPFDAPARRVKAAGLDLAAGDGTTVMCSATPAVVEEPVVEEQPAIALPDYMIDMNAVLTDHIPWRHGHTPDYSAANGNFLKERSNVWPPGSLEDLVSNLVKNWEKEASYKTRLQDWRTINSNSYRFSCNGGREYTADEMMQIGTYNALIQEAAFYSAKHTSFDESHEVFRRAMPGGFSWEVTEVYSGPPVVAFKWRHWGRMTGKLVCPIGPDTKLEADPTNQEVEIFGVCVCQLDSNFKICKLEIFYDPHELMASLVDARNLCYKSPDNEGKIRQSMDMGTLNQMMDTIQTSDDGYLHPHEELSERDGARSLQSDSLASDLPSDATLLASISERPQGGLPGSRCPFPHT